MLRFVPRSDKQAGLPGAKRASRKVDLGAFELTGRYGHSGRVTITLPLLESTALSLGTARRVCDPEFARQPGQMPVRRPERHVRNKGGRQQMRIDPPNASAEKLV